MADAVPFTTPVGRLVQGSLYKGSTTDAEGNPLVIKSGPNAGQPRTDYFFALAIPKGNEQSWAQTEWGKMIYDVGVKGFPNGQYNAPTFAWKIIDGDSTVPNRRGRKPCDREGFKGHWVLNFSSGYAPRIFNANGSQALTDPDHVKLGYYVQVAGTVSGNGSTQQPGVYLNHSMVALAGFGPEIVVGPDPTAVGFGNAALPAGASATPLGGLPGAAPSLPGMPAAAAPAAPAAPGIQPHPGLLNPAAPAAPPVPPPAAPVRQMTDKAQGMTYEQMVAAGWNDALLIQHGYMAA